MSDIKKPRPRRKPRRVVVARNVQNKVNNYTVPIIFVPGVMGSRLIWQTGQPPEVHTWDPDHTASMRQWAKPFSTDWQRSVMQCAAPDDFSQDTVMRQNENYQLSEDEVVRGWGGVSFKYHGQFLRDGYSQRYNPVYAFGYDWRNSNYNSARRLAVRIDEILARHRAQRCIIVTHSMGGLVTRAALRLIAGLESKVLCVVHLFQPVLGTPVAYRRFFTGVTATYDGGAAAAGFGVIVGNTGEKFTKIISALEGPLQLMPAENYQNVGNFPWLRYTIGDQIGQWNQSIYDTYLSEGQPPGVVAGDVTGGMSDVRNDLVSRIRHAQAFHNALQPGGNLYRHPLTFALYGRGLRTDVMVEYEKLSGWQGWRARNTPSITNGRYVVGNDGYALKLTDWQRPVDGGDGTVAEHSARALFPDQHFFAPPASWQKVGLDGRGGDGVRQYLINGVEHAVAANDLKVRQTVLFIIYRILYGHGLLPG